ncbi:EAL domain, c-di-GMP-specific phosphodiesterase class I (or its enzymatically inactive variant) [Nakamurella panacisegetis]|uniref:EAL domain, c-di-GMP-specific phosphodiesterase class I (Or its enzymatically inactive variant) n=1 Tax=Nakamurella panacisegetis TaxID=1090615 RepID=A0A1H0L2W5_9ACTN|nr:EAL domain, c-di-GMP-specific phosphodiesterase class I (or its enzymatically inactive variant) [Nakamurella panacisegetis]
MDLVQHSRRQHASARHYIDKTTHSVALDESVRLIGNWFQFPMVQVNVLDMRNQHTIAAVGTPLGITPRSQSLCDPVVRGGVPATLGQIERAPGVFPQIQSYIGVPIVGREGIVVATLCLLDTVPRLFTARQIGELQTLALMVRDQLELLRRLEPTPAGTPALTAALTAAVEAGEIIPVFQPVVGLVDGTVQGLEALARWQHPTRGLLTPEAFVPLAEDSEVIIDLDLAVLQQAAAHVAGWTRRRPYLRLNANLSARHFDHPDCVDRLTDSVTDAGLSPTQVTLEVTETAALAAHPADRSFLHELRARGFRVALDDFGMGFSSIGQVLRLPIDGIKIDRQVTAASETAVGEAVFRALLGLGADLGLNTVVEGVETSAQADRARKSGAAQGQGYLYAAPLFPVDVPDCLGIIHR